MASRAGSWRGYNQERRGAGAWLVSAFLALALLGLQPASAAGAGVPATGSVVLTPADGVSVEALADVLGGVALPSSNAVWLAQAPPPAVDLDGVVAGHRPDLPISLAQAPSDPGWGRHWALRQAGFEGVFDAVDGGQDLESVLVAVVDTGVDATHPDLAGRLAPPITIVGLPGTDIGVHGTAVAGIIAGIRDNAVGVTGGCGNCTVLPVKVFDEDGTSSSALFAEGIRQAVDAGADIISASIVVNDHLEAPDIAAAIRHAQAQGAVVVASAGNDGQDVPNFPAAQDGVLSVAANDEGGGRSSYTSHGDWVDYSVGGCMPVLNPGGTFADGCGTSYATPLLVAAVGTLLGAGHDPADIEGLLDATAVPIDHVGVGRLDIGAHVEDSVIAIPEAPEPGPEPEPEPEPEPQPGPQPDDLVPFEETQTVGDGLAPQALATAMSQAVVADDAGQLVMIANAGQFADSLAGSALAGLGPVLLTERADAGGTAADADDILLAEVTRILPDAGQDCDPADPDVVILGGPAAVGQATQDALVADGRCVVRLAGASRAETALAVADFVLARTDGTQVVVARGFAPATNPSAAWADAASVGAWAGSTTTPIVLVNEGVDPAEDATVRWLAAHPQVRTATIVGGEAAVGAGHAAALCNPAAAVADTPGDLCAADATTTVTRISGDDRAATSLAIAEQLWQPGNRGVMVVDGDSPQGWAAALTAAHPGAVEGAPVIYDRPATRPTIDAARWRWLVG